MSTRRQRELLLTSDQRVYMAQAFDASLNRVQKLFRPTSPAAYEGSEHDRQIARQVLNGVIYEIRRDLNDTLTRITKRHIP